MLRRIRMVILSVAVSANLSQAQNLFNPYSSQGYSYGYGINPNTIPFDITLSQLGLGIGIPSPYSYLYSTSTYNPQDSLYGPYSNFNPYPGNFGTSQLQQYQMPSFGSQLAMNFPALFQDYFDKMSTPIDDRAVASDDTSTTNNSSDDDKDTEEECGKFSTRIWKDNKCVYINDDECNAKEGRAWQGSSCKFLTSMGEESCGSVTRLAWLNNSCILKPNSPEDCSKITGGVWGTDKVCRDRSKLTAETCVLIPNTSWNGSECIDKPQLSTDRGDCPMSEAEAGYKFETKCGIITKEDCLDPKKHNGHPATWYHGLCWDVGCEKEEKKSDPFCLDATKEVAAILECQQKEGTWQETKRVGNRWEDGKCVLKKKQGKETSDGNGSFRLFVTPGADYLNSNKKISNVKIDFEQVNTCVNNIGFLENENLQIEREGEQIFFKDTKKINGKTQRGISVTENGDNFFIDESELIFQRNKLCKTEIQKSYHSKAACSFSIQVGDYSYVAKFTNDNLRSDSPSIIITSEESAGYESDYEARRYGKKTSFKSLYLGIENSITKLADDIEKDHSKNRCKKYGNDVSSDQIAGVLSCYKVLNSAWENEQDNETPLDKLIRVEDLCKKKKTSAGGTVQYSTEEASSNTSK